MLGTDGGNIAPFISVVPTPSDHPVAHKVTSDDRRAYQHLEIIFDLVQRYGFAIVVSCAALVLTHFSQRITHNDDFDICQAAVVLSAWYGGFGPGITAGRSEEHTSELQSL